MASEQIFNVLNTQHDYYEFIDLHGQFVVESKQIVSSRLKDIREAVVTGQIKPNYDSKNHVFKIICGKGNHSIGGVAKLKFAI